MRNALALGGDGRAVVARLAQDEIGLPLAAGGLVRGQHRGGVEAAEDLPVDEHRRLVGRDLRHAVPDLGQFGGGRGLAQPVRIAGRDDGRLQLGWYDQQDVIAARDQRIDEGNQWGEVTGSRGRGNEHAHPVTVSTVSVPAGVTLPLAQVLVRTTTGMVRPAFAWWSAKNG